MILSSFREIVTNILSDFSSDKFSIENMYFFITEQVKINQVQYIEDIRSIYPRASFKEVKENIRIRTSEYKVDSFVLDNKYEKITISFLKDNIIGQIKYTLNPKSKGKTNTLIYNNKEALNVEDDNKEYSDEFTIEIRRYSSDRKRFNKDREYEADFINSSIITLIKPVSIFEQKELYSDLK